MRIVMVNGSPRDNGNTIRAMNLIAEAAKQNGNVEVAAYHLNELDIKGCQGCLRCKEPGATICTLADDGRQVLQDMFDSETWIIGTPVYMGHMTGQLKLLLDRTYGYLAPGFVLRLPKGKKGVAVLTQGRKEPDAYQSLADMFKSMFDRRQFAYSQCLVVGGTDGRATGDIEFDQEVMTQLARVGEELATCAGQRE